MALRWENLASTTHSLTPRTENRPLFFGILTPCKKPGATGSAGRCEPGVGRFTDPHPLTCSFFTSPFCWLMFWLCALPSAPSSPSSEWEKISLPIEDILCSNALPLQAHLGLLFLFLPFLLHVSLFAPPCGEGLVFLTRGLLLFPDSPTTAPHWPNRACLVLRWCRFPTWPSKPHTGPHTGFSFCALSFPLRGKAGLISHLSCSVSPKFVHNCLTRPQQGR